MSSPTPPPPYRGDQSPYSPPPFAGQDEQSVPAAPASVPGYPAPGDQPYVSQTAAGQAHGAPGGYGAPTGYGAPGGYGAPAGTAAPGGYGSPVEQGVAGQPFYQQPPQRPGNGMAVAAFVVGLLSFLIAWIPVVNFVAIVGGIVAVILGVLALKKVRTGQAGGKGLAVAGVVLAGLSVVIAIVANVFLGAAISSFEESLQQQEQAAGPVVDTDPADEVTESSAGEDTSAGTDGDAAAPAPAPAGDVLALGESATVGDYTVTVTGMNLDATEAMAAPELFNEPAANQYVLADISVLYNGTEEGTAWLDLTYAFSGADNRQYDWSTCDAIEPSSVIEAPTLNTGGAADFQICMDIPAEAIEGGTFSVRETFSFDGASVTWNVR